METCATKKLRIGSPSKSLFFTLFAFIKAQQLLYSLHSDTSEIKEGGARLPVELACIKVCVLNLVQNVLIQTISNKILKWSQMSKMQSALLL